MLRFFNSIINPTVRDQRELTVYVESATGLAVAVALAVDIANQLVFFISWADSLRSWAITVFVAILIAVPILYGIGRTHL
jgi:cyanate permease